MKLGAPSRHEIVADNEGRGQIERRTAARIERERAFQAGDFAVHDRIGVGEGKGHAGAGARIFERTWVR